MAEEIARLVTVWDANFQKLDEKLNKIQRSHFKAASIIKKDADALANRLEKRWGGLGKALDNVFDDSRLAVLNTGSSRLSVFGSALEPLGAMGMAAAAGIGALAVAATQAIGAMRFADELDDAAQKLNIGVEALQEYRFAMTEVGGEAKDADAALGSFTKTLGLAQSGLSPKAMKGFSALGFTKEDLDRFGSGEEALAEVARRVAALGKESERAAVAEKLGLGPMLPLLREGAQEMERLRQKAQDLGYVMDEELVKTGAQANQEFETLSHVIDVQLKSAFVGLGDEVLTVVGAIASLLEKLNDVIEKSERLSRVTGGFNPSRVLQFGTAGGLVQGGVGLVRGALRGPEIIDREALARFVAGNGDGGGEDSGGRLSGTGGGGSGGAARTNREAEQRAQREDRAEEAVARLQREIDRARANDFGLASIASNADSARANIENELTEKLKAIDRDAEEYLRTNGLRGLSEAEAEIMRAREAELADVLMQGEDIKESLELSRYRLQQEEDAVQAANEYLDLTSQMMRSETDRVAVQRRILEAEQEIERKRLAQSLALDGNLSRAERDQKLSDFDRNAEAQTRLFDHRETERLRETFRSYGRDMIAAAKDGELGTYIADQLQQRLMDMALNGLFDILGGGQRGGGGIGAFLKSFIPGFAAGTASAPGGLSYVHAGEVLTNLPKGAGVIPAHAVRAMGALQGGVSVAGPASVPVDIRINLDGANGDQAIRDIAYRAAAEGSAVAVRQANDIARRSAPALQRRQRRLGTT